MWSRENTQEWLSQIENRLEDFEYYLHQTSEWCEVHGIWDDATIFMCCVMTIVWVSHMRGEQLTKNEVYELLGFDQHIDDNGLYELGKEFQDLDHESMLYKVVRDFSDD